MLDRQMRNTYDNSMRIIGWIRRNKLASVLALILIFFVLIPNILNFFYSSFSNMSSLPLNNASSDAIPASLPDSSSGNVQSSSFQNKQSASVSQNRIVSHEGTLSLQVSSVPTASDAVISQAQALGGFMISNSFSNPGEAPTATIEVRVPAVKLISYLSFVRKQALQVVSEDLTGEDITDQYTDTQSQLATLLAVKSKLEALLEKAVNVQDILDVQQRIIDLQNQIDQVKGQQQYLDQSAKLSKVTLYLSTDDLALPYAPTKAWRPTVIVKYALRSLLTNLQSLGSGVIWIGVYAVIWVPLLVLYILGRRFLQKGRDTVKTERKSTN